MKQLLNTLYVLTPNRYLSLDGETVAVSEDHVVLCRVPLHNLESIFLFGAAGVSPALIGKCASKQISLSLMDRNGKFMARMVGEEAGNVLLRRKQYRVADDAEASLSIARCMIAGKLFNSRWVLERTLRDHALCVDTARFSQKSQILQASLQTAMVADSMEMLRGVEGEGAAVYFSVFDEMILQQKEDFFFHGRNKRPPLDSVNALLSFAYSITTGMCTAALEAVGLDAYVGFMHTDRPGRRSLALDLLEEFRALMCDRFVLMLINKRMIDKKAFDFQENGAVWLNEDGRRCFLQAWQSRKQEEIKHPFLKEKVQWGMLPYVQALLLSRYLRGDLDAYPPFLWK